VSALYNEIEPYPAQWIRNLAAAGHIAPGVVDERSIKDLTPEDITTPQAHFFAGIGVWSAALRAAGYPDDFPVWTGSCPCQPFSSAGRGAGFDDARHLWPDWFRLISKRRPSCVVGEQVASPDGLAWLDAVQADLEGAGYAFAAFDLCAAGVGAPHIRQRLYFAAIAQDGLAHHHHHQQRLGRVTESWPCPEFAPGRDVDGRGVDGGLADDDGSQLDGRQRLTSTAPRGRISGPSDSGSTRGLGHADIHGAGRDTRASAGAEGGARLRAVGDEPRASGATGRLGFAGFAGLEGHARDENASAQPGRLGAQSPRPAPAPGPTNGHWADVDWLPCRDGKWRPIEPGAFPLAHGATQRVGRLKAYGNAIVAPLAQAFLEALKPSVAHLFPGALHD
jgi:DNA (cytosine-5)-methyltransferase 1